MEQKNDFRTELDYWIGMWDEAEKEGVHPRPEEVKKSELISGETAQDDYYDYLDGEPELLQEEDHHIPNPVYPDSVGPDHLTTEPVWVSEDLLKEVESLKNKLYKVENELAAKMGGGKKWVEKAHNPEDQKLMSEIESMRKRLEKVSSSLGIKEEPSPWVIKRD